ncbi:MAG: hypothetical protein J2P49_11335 [Methylocapsa sp.]|nr:hypothetical protein [Methylocapsa sp.]
MFFLFAMLAAVYFNSVTAARPEASAEHVCFSAAESREKIHAHGLFEPFQLMRAAAIRMRAEPVGVKLCRSQDDLIYELSLLRHDGHIIHVFVNAKSGQSVGAKNER